MKSECKESLIRTISNNPDALKLLLAWNYDPFDPRVTYEDMKKKLTDLDKYAENLTIVKTLRMQNISMYSPLLNIKKC